MSTARRASATIHALRKILIDNVPEVFIPWYKDIELLRHGVHIDDGANITMPYLWRPDIFDQTSDGP